MRCSTSEELTLRRGVVRKARIKEKSLQLSFVLYYEVCVQCKSLCPKYNIHVEREVMITAKIFGLHLHSVLPLTRNPVTVLPFCMVSLGLSHFLL